MNNINVGTVALKPVVKLLHPITFVSNLIGGFCIDIFAGWVYFFFLTNRLNFYLGFFSQKVPVCYYFAYELIFV